MPDDDEQFDPNAAREIVAALAAFFVSAAVALIAAAIYTADLMLAERLALWGLEAVVVAAGLGVFGAITWGSEDE